MDRTLWSLNDRFEFNDNRIKGLLMFGGTAVFGMMLIISHLSYEIAVLDGTCLGWDCSYPVYAVTGILLTVVLIPCVINCHRYLNKMDRIEEKYHK